MAGPLLPTGLSSPYVQYRTEVPKLEQAVCEALESVPRSVDNHGFGLDYRTEGYKNAENSSRHRACAGVAVALRNFFRSSEHRYRASKRKHRDQPAGIPGTRDRTRLPGLPRATTGSELLFLRRHVLGLP